MEFKIAKDCVADGVKLKAGDVVELPDIVAEKLKARGFILNPAARRKRRTADGWRISH